MIFASRQLDVLLMVLGCILLSNPAMSDDDSISDEWIDLTSVVCYGSMPEGDIQSFPSSPMGMQQYCTRNGIQTKCAYQYNPPELIFNLRGIHSARLADHWYPLFDEDSAQSQYQMLICSIKCRCEKETPSDDPEYGTKEPIKLDLNNVYEWNFDIKRSTGSGFTYDRSGPSLNLIEEGVNGESGQAGVHDDGQILVGSPLNNATCRPSQTHGNRLTPRLANALARYLPEGTDFNNPTALCLSEFYGGKKNLNFGGVCLHHLTMGDLQSLRRVAKLEFPHEYRSPEYTIDTHPGEPSGGLVGSLAFVQAFCRANCRCEGQAIEDASLARSELLIAASRFMSWIGQSSDSGLFPGSSSTSSTSSLNLEDGLELGLDPISESGSGDVGTCNANGCTGPGQCGDGCACQISQTVDPHHFDWAAALVATCMVYFRIVNNRNRKHHRHPRGLLDMNQHWCPCNSTYVSGACCDSLDGLVWEAPELKIGELKR